MQLVGVKPIKECWQFFLILMALGGAAWIMLWASGSPLEVDWLDLVVTAYFPMGYLATHAYANQWRSTYWLFGILSLWVLLGYLPFCAMLLYGIVKLAVTESALLALCTAIFMGGLLGLQVGPYVLLCLLMYRDKKRGRRECGVVGSSCA